MCYLVSSFTRKIMRKILFIFLTAAFFIPVSAQTRAKIKIRKSGLGKISVMKGKMSSVINLTEDVAGCAYVPSATKRELDKIECAAPPADFELVDAMEKNGQNFLILTASAQENCNVCGRCGASEATTVIWLKLDARLRVLEKKNVPIEYCQLNLSMVYPIGDFNEETQEEKFTFPFKDNVMTIEFEKTIYGDETTGSKDVFEFTHVEYDRAKPEKGFVIKTEKRNKSSMPEGQ